jgi:hypothetical protein
VIMVADDSARGYRVGSLCMGGMGGQRLLGAADKGHYVVVRTLLQHPETDPNTRDNQGERGG